MQCLWLFWLSWCPYRSQIWKCLRNWWKLNTSGAKKYLWRSGKFSTKIYGTYKNCERDFRKRKRSWFLNNLKIIPRLSKCNSISEIYGEIKSGWADLHLQHKWRKRKKKRTSRIIIWNLKSSAIWILIVWKSWKSFKWKRTFLERKIKFLKRDGASKKSTFRKRFINWSDPAWKKNLVRSKLRFTKDN